MGPRVVLSPGMDSWFPNQVHPSHFARQEGVSNVTVKCFLPRRPLASLAAGDDGGVCTWSGAPKSLSRSTVHVHPPPDLLHCR